MPINALYVPSTYHKISIWFIFISGGITINDVQKMHGEDPIVDNHSVTFDYSDLRIILKHNGVFYFHTRVPTERELHECEKLFLTPD